MPTLVAPAPLLPGAHVLPSPGLLPGVANSVPGAIDLPSWAPTPASVAALLMARTVDEDGIERGTWTSATRPTLNQVQTLLEFAILEVEDSLRYAVTDARHDDAARLAALRAAVLIEGSYFPGEVAEDRSPHRQYQAMFLSGIERLQAELGAKGNAYGTGGGYGSVAVRSGILSEDDGLIDWRHE